jgi:hypothetical protein
MPVWSLGFAAPLAAALIVGSWKFAGSDGRGELLGIMAAALALFVVGETRYRVATHDHLSDRIGELHVAWKELARTSSMNGDPRTLERLSEAMSEWECALAAAKAAVARWRVLDELIDRCDALVKRWWLHVGDDPGYRCQDKRLIAHHQADEALTVLCEGVTRRNIGHPLWRAWRLRLFVGRRVLAGLDQHKDRIC